MSDRLLKESDVLKLSYALPIILNSTFYKLVKSLPSVQPERKKGRWLDYTDEGYVECPFCHSATNCDGNKDELHFCFSCGADMRGDE